jgi:hypothetical protein
MPEAGIVLALGEDAIFRAGDKIRVLTRSPIGHYRVPAYLRGKSGMVESVIEPTGIDNEQERRKKASLLPHRCADEGDLASLRWLPA